MHPAVKPVQLSAQITIEGMGQATVVSPESRTTRAQSTL